MPPADFSLGKENYLGIYRSMVTARTIDKYEDHLVRKVADLIYVPHRSFIRAKHKERNLGYRA